MDYMKAEQVGTSKWRVLALPFGGPFDGKDLDGERFTARTDPYGPYKSLSEYPVVFQHAKDQEVDDEVLGYEDALTKERDGWWATLWLDRSNRYWAQVNAILARGKMYGSSGSIPQFVRKARDGEILIWPHLEQTLTPTPANPYSRIIPAKAVDYFSSAGIAWEDHADLPDLGPDLPSGGDDPAMVQLARARAQSDALLARIKAIY